MNIGQLYKNWQLEIDTDQIVWAYLDKAESSVNALSETVMNELSSLLDMLSEKNEYKGLVIASAKKTGFIAGADITEFKQISDEETAYNLLKKGQDIFTKLEELSIPTVALIDGFCLGGGLELALACRYRIVEDSPKTRLGLPEVKLGIQPGWGGSVRLIRLIGGMEGLNLILSGHTVSGKAAVKLGLADMAQPKRHLVTAAKYYILNTPKPHKLSILQNLTNQKLVRPVLAKFIRQKLAAKANPAHYPAPFMVLETWEKHGVESDDAYIREAASCAKLFTTDTSRNLVRVFFLQEKLKGLAKDLPTTDQHVHVLGAGTMGGDIAAWCALRGFKVTLQDIKPEFLSNAMKRAHVLFKDKLKEPHLVQKAMDHLIPDVTGYGAFKADVIIEAVVEDLEVKRKVFKELEQKAKPSAILATNTSSISLEEINTALRSPNRLVGIHFFNPVPMMQLVEVVKGDMTDEATFDAALRFVRQIDKLPLPVKSKPGFLVNRVLFPYMMLAMQMLDEGISATDIDKAMTNFGMPIGPVALADMVGLDVCLHVADHLNQFSTMTISPLLKQMVEEKKLGRKAGEGFYRYDKKGKIIAPSLPANSSSKLPLGEIAARLVLRIINESYYCLREGVVTDADLLDAGMIFGTGFAPFRGGPLHYAKTHDIVEKKGESVGV